MSTKPPYPDYFYEGAGVIDGRLWWEQSDVYWDLPFFSEMGLCPIPDRDANIAAREQLFAMRELPEDVLPLERSTDPAEPDI